MSCESVSAAGQSLAITRCTNSPGNDRVGSAAALWIARRRWFGDYAFLGKYKSHPDRRQQDFFFGLLRECVERNVIGEDLLREAMRRNHIRHDALELIDRAPKLAA